MRPVPFGWGLGAELMRVLMRRGGGELMRLLMRELMRYAVRRRISLPCRTRPASVTA